MKRLLVLVLMWALGTFASAQQISTSEREVLVGPLLGADAKPLTDLTFSTGDVWVWSGGEFLKMPNPKLRHVGLGWYELTKPRISSPGQVVVVVTHEDALMQAWHSYHAGLYEVNAVQVNSEKPQTADDFAKKIPDIASRSQQTLTLMIPRDVAIGFFVLIGILATGGVAIPRWRSRRISQQ